MGTLIVRLQRRGSKRERGGAHIRYVHANHPQEDFAIFGPHVAHVVFLIEGKIGVKYVVDELRRGEIAAAI